jgi:hypothetical protein
MIVHVRFMQHMIPAFSVRLLLDEPFSGLDVATALVLRRLIEELAGPRKSDPFQFSRSGNRGARLQTRCDSEITLLDLATHHSGLPRMPDNFDRGPEKSYADQLRAEITGPLGMTDTVLKLSGEQQRRFLRGYDDKHRPVRTFERDRALAGAVAILSTATTLVGKVGRLSSRLKK